MFRRPLYLKCSGSEDIAGCLAVLKGECLNDEKQQDADPQPVGTSETGGVEQGEGSEGGTSECHESREGYFPFVPCISYYKILFFLGRCGAEQQTLGTLHEQQEHKDGSEKGYQSPPVMLQKIQCIHNYSPPFLICLSMMLI